MQKVTKFWDHLQNYTRNMKDSYVRIKSIQMCTPRLYTTEISMSPVDMI